MHSVYQSVGGKKKITYAYALQRATVLTSSGVTAAVVGAVVAVVAVADELVSVITLCAGRVLCAVVPYTSTAALCDCPLER